jgi:hypothetical protein
MNNTMLFALILLGLLNQSSFILSSGRSPLPTPPLSQRQKEEIAQKQLKEIEAQKKMEAQKKQEREDAQNNLLGRYNSLSEQKKSNAGLPKTYDLPSDGRLDGFDKSKEVLPLPKTQVPLSSARIQLHAKNDRPCEFIHQLIINNHNTDTFLIKSATSNHKNPRYLLTEKQVRTLIDIFERTPECTVFITMSFSPDQDHASPAPEKTFSIAKSVLDSVNRKLLTPGITSDQEMVTNFSQQFDLLTKNGKNSSLSTTLPVESDEQKAKRLEIQAVSKGAKKILFKEDPRNQSSTLVTAESQTNTPTTSFYRSPLFWGGACTIAALAIAAFYYPGTEQLIELFKDFFKNSVNPNLDSPLE